MTHYRFLLFRLLLILVLTSIQSASNSHVPLSTSNNITVRQTVSTSVDDLTSSKRNSVQPNESGNIIIVMFHNFARQYSNNPHVEQPYTLTLQRFRQLLYVLYARNYRLISLADFYNNHIDIPEGMIPIVFTFDDATAGQFHLVKNESGEWVAAPNTAVGVLEAFHRKFPDFGLEGTFFINMGLTRPIFDGGGTLEERLKYLVSKGFEIGNHTWSHADLRKAASNLEVMQEVGQNQSALNAVLPGYQMQSLALPYGRTPKAAWMTATMSGDFDGVQYENQVVLGVGSKPSHSPTSTLFVPSDVHRVRAPGRDPVVTDLDWWLKKISPGRLYVSDGNPHVVTIPKNSYGQLARGFLKREKQHLIVY
ncbi:MAG: polysaccharide deacetylase family protein [Deltaproteobacteria bacterium]|nr:polysaccharide deacetylase family protein [Deltaproteobacteria bacterium]